MPKRGKGFDGQAIYVRATICEWGTAPEISGDFDDRLDLISESMSSSPTFQPSATLQGSADIRCDDLITENAGGSVTIEPAFDRIGRIWLNGMGFENYDSPVAIAGSDLSGHFIEPSDNLHCQCSGELLDCDTTGYDASQCFIRKGHLFIDKGGVRVEEFRDSMVQSINLSITPAGYGTMEVVFAPYRLLLHPLYPTTGWGIQAGESVSCEQLLFKNTELIVQPYNTSDSAFNANYAVDDGEVSISFENGLATDIKSASTGVYNSEPIRNAHRTAVLTFTCPVLKENMPGRYVDYKQGAIDHVRYMGRLRVTGADGREFTLIFPNLRFRVYNDPITGPGLITVTAELDVRGGLEPTTTWGIFAQWITDGAVWTNTGLLKSFYLYLVNDVAVNYLLG